MFLAVTVADNFCKLEEIPLKTVSDKRLMHYGFESGSTVFIMACHDLPVTSTLKQELKQLAQKALGCSEVLIEVTKEQKDLESQGNRGNILGDYLKEDYIPLPSNQHSSDPLRGAGGINTGSNNAVPDEYRDDPDLWYAIQASMQFEDGENQPN